jgi:hypothetical protein
VYALGLKTLEGGQTEALDIRALRDHQVPDARGRTIPSDAVSGQVNWSWAQQEEGEEPRNLIGRAEQSDTSGGVSSSYACVNCCPDSFLRGLFAPGDITGFPGDQTLCDAVQQDANCYGAPMEPFSVKAFWASDNTAVATIDSSGLATAQAVGSAWLRTWWTAFTFVDAGPRG